MEGRKVYRWALEVSPKSSYVLPQASCLQQRQLYLGQAKIQWKILDNALINH